MSPSLRQFLFTIAALVTAAIVAPSLRFKEPTPIAPGKPIPGLLVTQMDHNWWKL